MPERSNLNQNSQETTVARVNRLIFAANQDTGSEQEVRLSLKSQSPPTVVHFLLKALQQRHQLVIRCKNMWANGRDISHSNPSPQMRDPVGGKDWKPEDVGHTTHTESRSQCYHPFREGLGFQNLMLQVRTLWGYPSFIVWLTGPLHDVFLQEMTTYIHLKTYVIVFQANNNPQMSTNRWTNK